MSAWRDLVAILIAYALGCFTTAYYLVRWLRGQDIRELGSGNVGGRNAGRVLGPFGFIAVVVVDVLKGYLAIVVARALGAHQWAIIAALLAVVAGHIWPAPLGLRGGKGAATLVGALAAYQFVAALLLAGLFVLLFAITRSFTLGGLLAIAITPVALLLIGQPLIVVGAVLAASVIVLIAHRANIRARFHRSAATT